MSYQAGELDDAELYRIELEKRRQRDAEKKMEMVQWVKEFRERQEALGHPWRRPQHANAGRTKRKGSSRKRSSK